MVSDSEVDSASKHHFTTRKLREGLEDARKAFDKEGDTGKRKIARKLRFYSDDFPTIVPRRYAEGHKHAHWMLRQTVEELEKELLTASAEELAGEELEASTDAREDAEDQDDTPLKASLRSGTGVFEGREDSPDVGLCLFDGTGVFEGRDDSPDVQAVAALVQKVESNPFRRLRSRAGRRGCRSGGIC